MIPVLHGVWSAGGVVGDFEHIETVTVGSGGAASVTFSSIASTYKHLQIRGITRSTASAIAAEVYVRLNSDTGSNYVAHWVYGNGSNAFSGGSATSTTVMRVIQTSAANGTASCFGAFVADLLDYSSTSKNKTLRTLAGYELNTTDGSIGLNSGLWMNNTTAVNAVTVSLSSGNLAQHSTISLYGVK